MNNANIFSDMNNIFEISEQRKEYITETINALNIIELKFEKNEINEKLRKIAFFIFQKEIEKGNVESEKTRTTEGDVIKIKDKNVFIRLYRQRRFEKVDFIYDYPYIQTNKRGSINEFLPNKFSTAVNKIVEMIKSFNTKFTDELKWNDKEVIVIDSIPGLIEYYEQDYHSFKQRTLTKIEAIFSKTREYQCERKIKLRVHTKDKTGSEFISDDAINGDVFLYNNRNYSIVKTLIKKIDEFISVKLREKEELNQKILHTLEEYDLAKYLLLADI